MTERTFKRILSVQRWLHLASGHSEHFNETFYVIPLKQLRRWLATQEVPAEPLSGNDLGQVVHIRASDTKQYNLTPVAGQRMSCNWEGNRRSGIALAMHHRFKWSIHLWAQRLSKRSGSYIELLTQNRNSALYNLGSGS